MMFFRNNQPPKYKYEVTAYYPNNYPVPCSVGLLDTNDFKEACKMIDDKQEEMKTEFHILRYVSPEEGLRRYIYPYKGACKKNHERLVAA